MSSPLPCLSISKRWWWCVPWSRTACAAGFLHRSCGVQASKQVESTATLLCCLIPTLTRRQTPRLLPTTSLSSDTLLNPSSRLPLNRVSKTTSRQEMFNKQPVICYGEVYSRAASCHQLSDRRRGFVHTSNRPPSGPSCRRITSWGRSL